MTIKNVFNEGLQLIRKNLKFLLLFWSTNAVMAVLLSIPIFSMLLDNLQHSLLNEELTSGLNVLWFRQFMHLYDGTLERLPLLTYSIVALYGIIQTFYFGGLIAIFFNKNKNHISDFFYGGVRYWYRFMKILVISLVFFALSFKLNDLIGDLFTWLLSDYGYYLSDFILRSLRYLLLLIFIGAITLVSDYTKVSLAIDDETKVLRGLAKTIGFLKDNYQITIIVFLIISVLGAIGAIVYNIIDTFVPRTPYYFLILSFILQQMLIIFRLLIRMLFCASEVIIYSDTSAEFFESEVKESTVGVN